MMRETMSYEQTRDLWDRILRVCNDEPAPVEARLAAFARSEGFELVPYHDPEQHPDALGERVPAARAQLLTGNRIAVPDFAIDHAYSVAHEIAEARCGHEHTVEVFSEQANILARWLKRAVTTPSREGPPQL